MGRCVRQESKYSPDVKASGFCFVSKLMRQFLLLNRLARVEGNKIHDDIRSFYCCDGFYFSGDALDTGEGISKPIRSIVMHIFLIKVKGIQRTCGDKNRTVIVNYLYISAQSRSPPP